MKGLMSSSSSSSSSSTSPSSSPSVHVPKSECNASHLSLGRSSTSLQSKSVNLPSSSVPHVVDVGRLARAQSSSPSKFGVRSLTPVLTMERQPLYECQRKTSCKSSSKSINLTSLDNPSASITTRNERKARCETNYPQTDSKSEGVTVYYPSKSPMTQLLRQKEEKAATSAYIDKCLTPTLKLILVVLILGVMLLLYVVLLVVVIEGHQDLGQRVELLEKRRCAQLDLLQERLRP